MSLFRSNKRYVFDVEKIILIKWKSFKGLCEIHLTENHEVELSYTEEDDLDLINDLRNDFGYEQFEKEK